MYRIILFSLLIAAAVSLIVLSVSSNDILPTIRQTVNGPVEGIEKISSLGQKYYSFRGIPFAEAPITGTDPYTGEQVDRRFKSPEPIKRRWTNALKVHGFGKTCAQPVDPEFPSDLLKMGEDCLFLNIYVPAGGSMNKTVLVWIYGGGFNVGDATDFLYGPDFLLSQDNIVVTINYRVGIFGFLNLNFGEYTGNMGLKDQQLALKWVHENIENFSGNKSEVLIFGESAGGASVQFQMLNKESRSYFQRAYAASGSVFNAFAITKADHVQSIRECSKINEMDKLMEYLKTENSTTLVNCPYVDTSALNYDTFFAPVIESNSVKGGFLTKTPEQIYNGPNDEVPIMDTMFSITGQESLWNLMRMSPSDISNPLIKENVMETTGFKLPFRGFTQTVYPKEYEAVLKNLRESYFSNATSIDAIIRANGDLLSDAWFNYGVVESIALQSTANKKITSQNEPKKTFLFRFNVTADLNVSNILAKTKFSDAVHMDDICYSFHCHSLDETNEYDEHLKSKDLNYDLIMRFVKMITNFARTGDPSIEGDTPFKSINSIDEIFCQEITNELKTSVTTDIRHHVHYDVWHEIDEIYKSLGL